MKANKHLKNARTTDQRRTATGSIPGEQAQNNNQNMVLSKYFFLILMPFFINCTFSYPHTNYFIKQQHQVIKKCHYEIKRIINIIFQITQLKQ